MDVVGLHGWVLGFAVVGSWLVVSLWSLVLRLARAGDTPWFWRAVSVAQILLTAQFLLGLVLVARWAFGTGGPPGDGSAFDVSFHLLYGAGFPLVVLLFGHKWARDGRIHPHTAFAIVGLVNFGLTARAWMVGAGIG